MEMLPLRLWHVMAALGSFLGTPLPLLCSAHGELSNEPAYQCKGSELYSDLLGI